MTEIHGFHLGGRVKVRISYVFAGVHPRLGDVLHRVLEIVEASEGEQERYQRFLADTLDSVVNTAEDCRRLLAQTELVETGKESEIVVQGNSVTIVLSANLARVSIDVDPAWVNSPEGNIELRFWKATLKGLESFLSMPASPSSVVEVTLA